MTEFLISCLIKALNSPSLSFSVPENILHTVLLLRRTEQTRSSHPGSRCWLAARSSATEPLLPPPAPHVPCPTSRESTTSIRVWAGGGRSNRGPSTALRETHTHTHRGEGVGGDRNVKAAGVVGGWGSWKQQHERFLSYYALQCNYITDKHTGSALPLHIVSSRWRWVKSLASICSQLFWSDNDLRQF